MRSPVTSKALFNAKRFTVEEVQQVADDGSLLCRHIVRHPGAVVILPITNDDKVVLIRNYRIAVGRWLLELPAGTLEPPEPPLVSAHRELIEETGYSAQKMSLITTFVMSPGILDEKMYFYVATAMTEGNPNREPGECIHNFPCSWSEIDRLLRDGLIEDSKTLTSLLWYLRYREHA